MLGNKPHSYRMGVETLEDKRLLAGDITVSVMDGSLLIRGDAESNGVAITSGNAPGEFIVAGLPVDDVATSINGIFDRAVVSGVSRGIHMTLGRGDDVANMFAANVRGNVSIQTGIGNDRVHMGGPRTQMGDAGEANTRIGGRLAVDLSEGDDHLLVSGVATGHGLDVEGGMGNDEVLIRDSRLTGLVGIGTGAGEDRVVVEGTRATWAHIRSGLGADRVALVDSVFAALSVNVGEGDDVVAVAGIRARAAWFQGGLGNDRLEIAGANRMGQLQVNGFESIQGDAGAATTNALLDALADGYGAASEVSRLSMT